MIRVLFPDGVEVFSDDFDTMSTYINAETLRRWNVIVETPGIVAKSFDDNILAVSTGSTTGSCQVSAGGAYLPNGEYVYCSGATLSGLTTASMFASGSTYLAVQQVDTTGNTRPYLINGVDMYPTRAWNDQGPDVLALKNAITGSNYIVIAKLDAISTENLITLDTGATYRQVMQIPLVTAPTAPASLAITTGPEEDYIHSGHTAAKRSESTLAWASAAWAASTHLNGISTYFAKLDVLDNDDVIITGKTQTQIIQVGGGTGPIYTGVTFHNLTPGIKCTINVYGSSNASIPVMSTVATGASFFVGNIAQSTMPAVSITQRIGGIELAWDTSSAATGTTGITLFEVFASESSTTTGSTINYNDLVYRGYGGRAFVHGDLGDIVYTKVRGIDYSGQVTSDSGISRTVLTGPAAPTAPQNVRVSEITPSRSDYVASVFSNAYFSGAMRGGVNDGLAVCKWEWNWNDLEGTGIPDGHGMIFTNLSGATLNSLSGLRMWLSSNTTDYIITGNTVSTGSTTHVYVSDVYGVAVNISGETASSSDPGIIHCDADEYDVEFQTYTDDTVPVEVKQERTGVIIRRGTPINQIYKNTLRIGTRRKGSVKAINRGSTTPSTASESALTRIQLPDNAAWNTGATLGAVATEYGIELTISPDAVLTELSGIEFALVRASSGLSFTNLSHRPTMHDPTSKIGIAIERSATYQVGVRPILSGQVVGNELKTVIASGGGGFLPNVKTITVPVNTNPTNQQLIWDAVAGTIRISGQTGSIVSSDNPAKNVEGRFISVTSGINNYVFFANEMSSAVSGSVLYSYLDLKEVTNYGTDPAVLFASLQTGYTQGDGTTGVTNASTRRIHREPLNNEIKIINLSLDCSYTDGTDVDPGIIRVYQYGYSQSAVSLEVNSYGETPLTNEADLDILRNRGDLILVVDAYDPSNADANNKIIRGTLTIQYRDFAIKDRTPSLTFATG